MLNIFRRKGRTKRQQIDRLLGLLLISPWLIGLVLFKLAPILASLAISFTNFYMLNPQETRFIGLSNYLQVFEDQSVGYILFQTLAMAMGALPLQMTASLALAALLSSPRLKGRGLLRTLFFLPSIIPSVAILFIWQGFVQPGTGWLEKLIIQPMGLEGFNNMYSQAATNLLFGLNSLWSIGPGFLIILAALQGLPPEIQEAARVDGAGPLERFFAITLPLISPAIFFGIVINLITVFGGVILLDRGNVFSGSASPYDGYVSQVMFRQYELGYASALAWVFFVIVMGIILLLFSTSRRWVYYPDKGGQA